MSDVPTIGPPQPIDRHEEFLAAILSELRAIRLRLDGPDFSAPPGQVELRESQKMAAIPPRPQQQQQQKQYRR